MQSKNRNPIWRWLPRMAVLAVVVFLVAASLGLSQSKSDGQKKDVGKTSYDQIAPVILGKETFDEVMARDKANKEAIMARQKKTAGGAL